MPGYSGQPGRQRDPRTQTLTLLVAGLWLLILLTCVVGLRPVAAAALGPSFPAPATTAPAITAVPPTKMPTATATSPSQKPTATRTIGPTATGAAGATATPAGTGGGGGGDGSGGGGGFQGSGPQPTRVVLAQPTAGAGGDAGLQGLSPAAFGSNGLLVATTLSCVIGILGLVIAFIALSVLLRNGYGPFLRALLLGKRAGRRSASAVSPAGVGSGGRVGHTTSWDNEDAGRDYRGGGTRGEQRRGPPVPARSPQRQAPVSRSRANWR